jgi:hypothetical protein
MLSFINAETGAFGREFEKDAARFAKVNGLKSKAIDHRCRMRAALYEERRLH